MCFVSKLVACVAMATAMFAARFAAAAIMDIRNQIAFASLMIQCESSTEHLPVNIVAPYQAYTFNFNPETQEYWHCVVTTSPKQVDASIPVPDLWGRFFLYVRNPSFRPCTGLCSWIVDADGLSLVVKPGDSPTLTYSWAPHLLKFGSANCTA